MTNTSAAAVAIVDPPVDEAEQQGEFVNPYPEPVADPAIGKGVPRTLNRVLFASLPHFSWDTSGDHPPLAVPVGAVVWGDHFFALGLDDQVVGRLCAGNEYLTFADFNEFVEKFGTQVPIAKAELRAGVKDPHPEWDATGDAIAICFTGALLPVVASSLKTWAIDEEITPEVIADAYDAVMREEVALKIPRPPLISAPADDAENIPTPVAELRKDIPTTAGEYPDGSRKKPRGPQDNLPA